MRARVEVVKVKEGKEAVPTREPDLRMELKRGSMRDKWGLTLVHRIGDGGRIELGVSKVALLSYFCQLMFCFVFRWQCSAQLPRRALCRVNTIIEPYYVFISFRR